MAKNNAQMTFNFMPELPFDAWEAINQLRTNLEFCGKDKKVIMLTSSIPNEGKSFISFQLWKTMADMGYKTLFVDMDLRNSEVAHLYDMKCSEPKPVGIAHYLSGQCGLNDAVYKTSISNGYIMPVLNTINNPSILLESKSMENLFEQARHVFDYIIVDTPPVQVVADAMTISKYVDGTVLVCGSGRVSKKVLSNSAALLNRTTAPVLGTVLARIDTSKRSSYGGGYNSYGGYGGYGGYGQG